MRYLAIWLGLAVGPIFAAAPSNVVVQSTSQQAILDFDIDDPGQCTVAVYSDAARTRLVNDSDTTIDPNAQKCSRALPGAIVNNGVNNGHVQFIVGQRASKKSAADGKLYSLSLQTAATYYYTIANTADSTTVQDKFDTPTLPLGNMYPELPPFDFTGTNWANDAYPTFSYDDNTRQYVDPVWGTLVTPVPYIRKELISYGNKLQSPAVDLTGGKWTNLSNCGNNDGGAVNCSSNGAGAADYLFLPLAHFNSNQGLILSGWRPEGNVDDIRVRIYCGSSGAPQTVRVWLTKDSGQTRSGSGFDVVCPAGTPPTNNLSSPTRIVPAINPKGFFANWAPVDFIRSEIVPGSGHVTVAGGTSVTLLDGDFFPPTLAANSLINIAGAYYKIASIQDGSHLTLRAAASDGAGQSYTMANFGVIVANITGANVTLSVGVDDAEVFQPGQGTFNAAVPPCSNNPVTFTTNAVGAPIPATMGYLCTDEEYSLYFYIPKNADGSWRLEMRPAGGNVINGSADSQVNAAGDTFDPNYGSILGFDPADPLKYYAAVGLRLFSVKYDTTLSPACRQFQAYFYGNRGGYTELYTGVGPNEGCWRWTNLTPSNVNPSKDVNAQVRAAWPTGLNAAGDRVGPAHPAMNDISWMSLTGYNMDSGNGVLGGLLCLKGWIQQGSMSIFSCFDPVTGILKSLTDSWSSWPSRWASSHSSTTADLGGWWSNSAIPTTGANPIPFQSAHQALVKKVNRAGADSAPQWDSTTAVSAGESYNCPAVSDPRITPYFGDVGGTSNCIQVEVGSMACNQTPSTGLLFSGGVQKEAEAFPCSTPGFGVPSSAGGWSKLQDFDVGDWVSDFGPGALSGGSEVMAIVRIDIISADAINVWLYRKADAKAIQPLLPPEDYGRCAPGGSGARDALVHPDGWSMSMSPTLSCAGLSYWLYNVNDPTATWVPGNSFVTGSHGTTGIGPVPGKVSMIEGGALTYYTAIGQTPAGINFHALSSGPALFPRWRTRAASGYNAQSYASLTQTVAAASDLRWALDTRALAPGFGAGPEIPNACLNPAPMTMARQAGTSQTYLINDPSSAQPIDLKNAQQMKYAGRYNLNDFSGPATGNVFGDDRNWGVCYAYKANECRSGSSAGSIYVSLPAADNNQGCALEGQNSRNSPVFANLNPESGALVNFDYTQHDQIGLNERKLSFMLRGPGRQYQFNHAWAMADGQAAMYRADWVDGRWAGLWLMAMPPFSDNDGLHQVDFYQKQFDLLPGSPSAPNARVRFGYAENGPANKFYCTSRREECSTEGTPFAFTSSDSRTLLDCSAGCTISVPAISGRTMFYKVDRLDSAGNIVESSALSAVAIP